MISSVLSHLGVKTPLFFQTAILKRMVPVERDASQPVCEEKTC